MKKHIAISLVISLIVFIFGSCVLHNINNKAIATIDIFNDYTIVAGVIRNSGDGWKLIQDNSHETIGIKDITENDEKIIITYDEKTKVNALSVTVDETMASDGYRVGASVGTYETYIFIYDKENNKVSPKDYVNNLGNIWIEGIFKK